MAGDALAVPEFQTALVRLSDHLAGEVRTLTSKLSTLDRRSALSYVTDAYPGLASPYLAAAGDLSAEWYEAQPAALGAKAFRAAPAELPAFDQLAANGRWAMLQRDPGTALVGASRRATFNQSRETILNNVEDEGTRWVRHARAGACGFCRMLATRVLTEGSRGAPGLYRSEGAASRNTHRWDASGHDFCRCIAVPLRGGAEYVVPDYLPQWLDDYEAVSRDADGVLLPPQTIANRMEAIGREREAAKAASRRRPAPDQGRPVVDVVDLDAPATAAREQVAAAQRLTERNAVRAEQVAKPVADRVAQAAAIADRADELVSTAARVTGHVKKATDVADKLLGSQYPAIRSVKTLVDAADKGLQTANKVTGGVVEVAKVADQTLKDTVSIAHGVRQIADEVGGVLDEAAAIAIGARTLLTDAGKAARSTAADVRSAGSVQDFADRITAAVDTATGFQAEGAALVERARATVETTQNVVQAITELPDVLRRPVADMQQLAQTVRDVAADVDQAGADAGAVARSVRRLVDALRDYRRAEAARSPIRVTSERVDVDGPRALPAGASDARQLPAGDRLPAVIVDGRRAPIRVHSERLDVDPSAIEAPARQLAIERVPGPTALDSGRQPLMLTAAPQRLAIEAPKVPAPDRGAIAEWLNAEQAHRDALEAWRRVDAEPLPAAEAIADTVAPAARTKGDDLRDALAKAEAEAAEPDNRTSASAKQKQQRRDARALAVKNARRDLAAAEADGSVDDVLVVKAKRAKSRPASEVEAERLAAADAEIDEAVAAFEDACATGDDAAIAAAADRMEALEQANEAAKAAYAERAEKIAAKTEQQRARREAAKRAEQDEIGALIEAGEDPMQAEATVVAKRTGKDVQQVLETIRKREFLRECASDGITGGGFEAVLDRKFKQEAEILFLEAEEATNGYMVKREYALKFNPKRLWSCNDATARKVMSEEMANWFDENGRLTKPVMRAMILDGDTNFRRRTVLNEDYNQ